MPSIDSWLADIGLQKYATAFEDAEIDFETLPDLLEEDLKELGLPLGPRRKIWKAISQLAAAPAMPVKGAAADPADESVAHAERRHLTVMFVDLVGSTEMVMRMDAEDMRGIITKYQSAVADVVAEFDGFVATLLGDGVMCYFGWPHANEDDTDRAVRAGLAIIDATRRITTPDGAALASRVGVAAGIVVVGDLTGGDARQEAAVVGETPNLAARLQAVAEPNQLVVPSEVLPLLGTGFELLSLGPQEFKGIGRPVEAFVVKGEAAVESRFAARRTGSITPIVGRDAEVSTILECWSSAKSGQGRMVVLDGEAGIGKSRVVQAVIDAVSTDNSRRMMFQCSPYHTESAYYPIIQQMSSAAGFAADDSTDVRLSKMEALVEGDHRTHGLVAILLGIDGTARYGDLDMPPTQLRALVMQTFVQLLIKAAQDKPLMLVFEDIHWIDPTSLELLDAILANVADHKIMILATARPSFDHDFQAPDLVTQLELSRLGRDMTRAVVGKLTSGRTLPDEIMNLIARRTDGVPLFIEELTKTILENGALLADGDGYLVNGALGDIAIPATLHDSLMARLDRLNPIKEIAQIAACIGREFSHDLISRICDLSKDKLESALDQLIAAELIGPSGAPAQRTYLFKHALVRDAAYESLLKKRRRLFHQRILNALEEKPDTAPELLATHAEAAGLTDRAIALWAAAGKAAISRPAYKEGEAHLRRAIALNAPQVTAGDRDALEKAVDLKVQLFVAISPGKGLWSDEALTTLEEALELADRLGETPLRGDIIYGLLMSTYFRGSLERSIARADELNHLANKSGDMAQLLVAKRLAAIGRLKMGRFTEAQPYLDDAEAQCQQVADQNLADRFGHDPIVGVKIYQSLSATFQGQTARAEKFRVEAENRAREIAHINTTCAMLGLAVTGAHVADDIHAERRHLRILQPLIEEHDVTSSRLWAEATFALLRMAEGDPAGLDAYLDVEAAMLDANIRLLVPGNRVVAARRARLLGQTDAAKDLIEAALNMMEETGEKSWLPEAHRLRASFAFDQQDHDLAEQDLRYAIKIAHRDGGTLWELRAAIDLAKLCQSTDRFDEAAFAIGPVLQKIKGGDCPREMAMVRGLGPALSA